MSIDGINEYLSDFFEYNSPHRIIARNAGIEYISDEQKMDSVVKEENDSNDLKTQKKAPIVDDATRRKYSLTESPCESVAILSSLTDEQLITFKDKFIGEMKQYMDYYATPEEFRCIESKPFMTDEMYGYSERMLALVDNELDRRRSKKK